MTISKINALCAIVFFSSITAVTLSAHTIQQDCSKENVIDNVFPIHKPTEPIRRPSKKRPVHVSSFDTHINFILKEEGGYNKDDGNGYPVNFGINQKYHPDINVKSLTKSSAKEIYRTRYADMINYNALDDKMKLLALDAVINQGATWTRQALKKANNNPKKFRDMRRIRYQGVAKNPKKRKYLSGWLDRLSRVYAESKKHNMTAQIVDTCSYHTVKKGDTEWRLSHVLYPKAVITKNGITINSNIAVGETLTVCNSI